MAGAVRFKLKILPFHRGVSELLCEDLTCVVVKDHAPCASETAPPPAREREILTPGRGLPARSVTVPDSPAKEATAETASTTMSCWNGFMAQAPRLCSHTNDDSRFPGPKRPDRKSTRLNSSHANIS